ncbi:hypothetical protein [Cytophaga aurantiaca]|uniref:hypothetical protein n=1 Tax=Cytophaga aurantiaca TaxID=29530 RepID=UPI000382E359|nr:hypothetical protein [Cytophaga aurantiaca]
MENRASIIDNSISKQYAEELEKLASEDGCDSIRFFIAPDKNVSVESVIEDARAFFMAIKNTTDSDMELIHHSK